MDDNGYGYESEGYFRNMFKSFVCVVLSLLLGLQVYTYFWSPQEAMDVDFSEIKNVILQLSHGLADVKRKHEKLQIEIEGISAAIPAVAAAAGRAKEALEPSTRQSPQRHLNVYDYDRQIVDYALETAGARVIDTGETVEHINYESPVSWVLHMITSILCKGCPSAETMLKPGALPGECWAFKGSKGEATIRLLGTVHVTGVSIEHIPVVISPTREISSAPRLFKLEGLEFRGDPYPFDFGTFEYDKNGMSIQYFEVEHLSPKGYSLVRIRFLSNWGHSVYTCVYRVRVHGELVTQNMVTDEAEVSNDT